jgi:hypothetical protein
MVKLSGILEYSMGGFLCLRGFADYKHYPEFQKKTLMCKGHSSKNIKVKWPNS